MSRRLRAGARSHESDQHLERRRDGQHPYRHSPTCGCLFIMNTARVHTLPIHTGVETRMPVNVNTTDA